MRLEVGVTIDAPAHVIWGIVQNAPRRPEWDYRVFECEKLTEGPVGKGTRCRMAGSAGMRFSMVYEYVSFEPISRCSVKFTEITGMPLASGGGGWTFQDLDNGRCDFTTRGQFQMARIPFAGFLERFILEPMVNWMTRRSLQNLKRVAEAEWRRQNGSLPPKQSPQSRHRAEVPAPTSSI
jgi:uncharacterized protein YndB with AHSA1/START domain